MSSGDEAATVEEEDRHLPSLLDDDFGGGRSLRRDGLELEV
jgi:hypothetical protein